MKVRYAKGPVVYLYDLATRKKKAKQLLWGDWLRITGSIDDEWSEILWGKTKYAIKKSDYQEDRLLELIFLDVGQGDGCILTTPRLGDREKVMVIDAGDGSNMRGYLDYRFRDFKKKFTFHAAVITHPDRDHYRGFQKVFENEQVSFSHVYHNGILERTGDDLFGPVADGYVTDIRASNTSAHNLYSDKSTRGRKLYPKLIWTALTSDRFGEVAMLSTHHGQKEDGKTWMPGFAPSDNADFTIEILGPVVEKTPGGTRGLRTFGDSINSVAMDTGKTKNGHSVLLRLQYHGFSMLFGGDLNAPAEHFLVRHYGNGGDAPSTVAETEHMLANARERFGVDLMKCCHHGSSDVTDEFLESTRAAGFVVSSGDNESHVHPRPDLLGLLGKMGRGQRPLVLCTELLRSTREREDPALRRKLDKTVDKIANESSKDSPDADKLADLERTRADILDDVFKRNVGVYGAINVRSDGKHVVVAFRKEATKGTSRWFYYEMEKDAAGTLQVKGTSGH